MHDNMTNGQEDPPKSLELIKKSELFPKKELVSDDSTLHVPFPVLCGESPEFLGRTADGIIALSNFRLFIRYKGSFINVPLGLIESLESRDIFYLNIYCKDATVVRCAFSTNDTCLDWYKRIQSKMMVSRELNDLFAFAFHAWCVDRNPCPDPILEECYQLCPQGEKFTYSFTKEVERMGFDLKNAWRFTEINKNFEVSPSYPSEHLIPKCVTDDHLKMVANFRSLHRFPTVVWRNTQNGAVLVRCSQPELGWFGWRNTQDESMLNAIPEACALNPGKKNRSHKHGDDSSSSSESGSPDRDVGVVQNGVADEPKKMLIVDCRSYSAAFANRAKGGGVECVEYYHNCEIQFMSLANIHVIRKSFVALRALCSGGPDQASWLSVLENSKWLQYVGGIIKAATQVATVNQKEGRSVLVHCSDGWDRTPQITALAELLLDPYYRTVEGFQVLVEREWLEFGHKFADRCDNGPCCDDLNERCPVFLQWLDCVYQVYKQFPCQFQFNEAFLVKLVQHTYSCLFGTFLCNTAKERKERNIAQRTASVWCLLSNKKFQNLLYSDSAEHPVLYPSAHVSNLVLWSSVYLSNNSSSTSAPEEISNQQAIPLPPPADTEQTTGNANLQKTRSCENLASLPDHATSPSRRRSDPNIALDMPEQAAKLLISAQDGDSTPDLSSTDNVSSSNGTLPNDTGSEEEKEEENRSELTDDAKDIECQKENTIRSEHLNDINGDIQQHLNGTCDTENDRHSSEDETSENERKDSNSQTEIASQMLQSPNADVSVNRVNSITNSAEQSDIPSNGLTNGNSSSCDSESDIDADNNDNGRDKLVSKSASERTLLPSSGDIPLQSVESSTDTIVDDVGNAKEVCDKDGNTPTAVVNSLYNNLSLDKSSSKAKCDKTTINLLKSLENSSSISTSTSDLSDSHVALQRENGCNNSLRHNLKLSCYLAQNASWNGHNMTNGCSKVVTNGSTPPLYPTPVSPRSQSSTCPPTPGTSDGKSVDSPVRHLYGVGRQLDLDGLTSFCDPVQQRMQAMEVSYKEKITSLETQVAYYQQLLSQQAFVNGDRGCLDSKDDHLDPRLDSCENGDLHSLGNVSNAASDASWDQMEEHEVPMTLWVPDHAVTHCAGCDGAFNAFRRKHHCRNCGKIFCSTCAKDYMPLPHQQLVEPERVCGPCYKLLVLNLSNSIIELENGIIDDRTVTAAGSS